MFSPIMDLTLTPADRTDLDAIVRATSAPAGLVRRARCILLLGDGASYSTICARLTVTDRFVSQWKRRFLGLLSIECG